MSVEPKTLEPNIGVKCRYKCRIPRRLQRPLPKLKPCNIEHATRPTSANRATDDVGQPSGCGEAASGSARPEQKLHSITQKRPPMHRKKVVNEKLHQMRNNQTGMQIITVPLKQKYTRKAAYYNQLSTNLPDQGTIKKCEDLELQQEDFSDAAHMYNLVNDIFLDANAEEFITSRSDDTLQLQTYWQEKIVQFEEMKNDLNDRQNSILKLYAILRNTKQKLMSMGQKTELPSTDDLRIMNVANMTPYQLLQLCAETKSLRNENQIKSGLMIDLKKFNEIPLKLVATCEQTLAARKELIGWFENLKNQQKGCSKSYLTKKINEFYEESEMLSSTLDAVKDEFLNEMNDVIRTCLNERVAFRLRSEELTCEVSELNSHNSDLKTQLYNADKQKAYSYINKIRIEELEKELKDENIKKIALRDRLSRGEGQVKIEADRATQLEAALNQSRLQTRTLERTIQHLHEQNQKLQKDFDMELNKLKESMKTNTTHLEEIATSRETLQQEKEHFKKRLEELSCHYNDSLNTMKEELNKNIAKLIDAEKKYNDEIEIKKKLNKTIETQCAHLLEYEIRQKDIMNQLQEFGRTSFEVMNYKENLEQSKHQLDETIASLEKQNKLNTEQNETITEMEKKLKVSNELEKKIKTEISNKEDYIAALEKKHVLLQQQSQEYERKMQVYENQVNNLKDHISKMQEHLIDVENLNELRSSVNEQNAVLNETVRKNNEISAELQDKQKDLKHLKETITEQDDLIKQRQSVLQLLGEKVEEQSNILILKQQISEKDAEIHSLTRNRETRKQQISQLEKIILTMEDQNRKSVRQKRADQDKIGALERKIADYECYIARKNTASENIGNLIMVLEDELRTPFDSQSVTPNQTYGSSRNGNICNRSMQKCSGHSNQKETNSQSEAKATNILMGNFLKKTHVTNNDVPCENNNDTYIPREQAVRNIDTHVLIVPETDNNVVDSNKLMYTDRTKQTQHPKEEMLKNLQQILPIRVKDEKKCKMFKFASHRML